MMIFPVQRSPNHFNHMQRIPMNPMNPMMGFNRPPVNPSGGIQQLIQRFINPTSSATSLTTQGAHGLSNTLKNVQQVLKVIQSATPIVQEYGPLIKNLPTMYKMYKAMKEINIEDDKESGEEEVETKEKQQNNDHSIEMDHTESDHLSNTTTETQQNVKHATGQSIPKLYI